MLRVSAHQPAYLPWLGYLHKIAAVDVFVYLDQVQFEKNSYINRNRIKTPQGPLWLTVPVKMKGHIDGSLAEMQLDDGQPWRAKHLKSIAANYCKAPWFAQNFARFERQVNTPQSLLSELCWQQLQFWLQEFNIKTRIVRQSALQPTGRKSDLVLDICRQLGATHYLSGTLGRDYLQTEAFAAAGITIDFQQFEHPVHAQLWGEFVPALSALDYWMNCGSDLQPVFARQAQQAVVHGTEHSGVAHA